MHIDPLVGAAVVSAIPTTLAAVLSYRGLKQMKQVSAQADANNEALGRVERATNGEMTRKIREAVRSELIAHSGATQEMYDLIDAILRNVQGEHDV